MMTNRAIIIVGDLAPPADCKDAHVYVYPKNITEKRFYRELKDLKEFYDEVSVQLPIPQHIRIKEVK